MGPRRETLRIAERTITLPGREDPLRFRIGVNAREVATEINRIDIYKQAATASKTPLPKSEMRSHKLVDGVVWDGKDPAKYADGFKVKV